MRLLTLRMQNIKTYIDQTINFSEGINCILGLNGGGKSTIIESIGYALFGYSKGKKNSLMVRHGEKSGQIELDFIANDGCRYRIEKMIKIKGAGKASMYDESGMIFDKDEDIIACVKRVLKIQTSQDLSKLYEDVIAVPQGKYVSAFLLTSSARKAEFDKLLGLEQYRNIWAKLRDLKNYIDQSEKSPLENESSRIAGACQDHKDKIKNRDNLSKEIANLSNQYDKIYADFLEAKKICENNEKIKENINEIEKKIANFSVKINAKKEQKNNTKKALEIAQKSLEIVEKNEQFFNKFSANEKDIKELINSQKEFKNIAKKSSEIQTSIAKIEATIFNLKETIGEDENSINNAENVILDKERNLAHDEKELIALRTEYDKENEALKEKENACNIEKETLSKEEYQLDRFFDKFNEIPHLEDNIQELINEKEQLKNKQIEVDKAKEELDKLNQKKATLEAQLNQKKELMILSSDGLCPIFKTECKATNKDISCEIKTQIDTITLEIQEVQNKCKELENITNTSKDIYASFFVIENDIKDYQNVINQISSLKASINNYYDISDSSYDIKELLEEKKNVLNARLLENDALNQSLLSKKESLTNMGSDVLTKELKCKTEKNIIVDDKAKLQKAKSDLHSKKDSLSAQTERLNSLNSDYEKIKELVKSNDEISEKIDNLREENDMLSDKKDLYLSNISEAKKVNQYLADIESLDNEVIALEKEKNSEQLELDNYFNEYDASKAALALEEKDKLANEEAKIKTMIGEKQIQLDVVSDEINKQTKMLKEKEEIDKKISKCINMISFIEKMRTIYQSLPQVLSKTYREGISNIASNLYRSISNDNYRIEISDDYNVNLINMAKEEDNTDISFLSGGEQMSVAIAVRLAMLKYLTNLDIYFLDEPTVNLDYERRVRVGEVVEEVKKDLVQIFVISHDDTFDAISQNLIKVLKEDGISRIIE